MVQWVAPSPQRKKVQGLDSDRRPFYAEFVCSSLFHLGFLWVLRFSPTVQSKDYSFRLMGESKWPPVMDWKPLKGAFLLLCSACWDRLMEHSLCLGSTSKSKELTIVFSVQRLLSFIRTSRSRYGAQALP